MERGKIKRKRDIILIGTMHHMFPKYKKEFGDILKKINPDQIMIEIDKKDLARDRIRTYPKEMVFAYKWAKKNKKRIGCFDIDIDLLEKGVSQRDEDRIEKDWFEKYGEIDWKFFNKSTKGERKSVWTIDQLIDQKKMKFRQIKMLGNIKKMLIKDGTILVLTGAYHLDFFRENFKEARLWFNYLK